MDSIIEQQRQAHEDIERLEQAIVDMMLQDLSKHRYKLIREQKIDSLLDQIQTRSKLILDLGRDESGLRHVEMDSIAEHQFTEFYSRLGNIRSHNRRNPDVAVHPPEIEYVKYMRNPEEIEEQQKARMARENALAMGEDALEIPFEDNLPAEQTFVSEEDEHRLDTMFSGEERLGRYVDLNEQHELYLNVRDAQRLSYLDYLAQFGKFELYPRKLKTSLQYAAYLDSLRGYFDGFFARAMPLFDLPKTTAEAKDKFADAWAAGTVLGWEASDDDHKLLCTVCNKQFEKETTFNAHMNSRKHQKAAARSEDGNASSDKQDAQKQAGDKKAEKEREAAWSESLIRTHILVLADKIRDTRSNVERRQALTEEERKQEVDEEEPEFEEDNEDKDEQIYNPLNLPMGWDGKPIPYWLYKLHGLGVKFSCEVCGNAIYRGRKAYEKHFQESRHATNMRRLGIPNTRQFHGMVAIGEAQSLWERIQKEKKQVVASTDTFEEYEDSEGNVFNKKTYFDLKRQGLI
ncbi:Pre-mRNA-splicing factor sap61 [Kickxella alabastrina]|uniref:Pre-mRNA-splicing factor sap61 n=1 Tax=Kickxella alabastrina TaxID=61397 RepID=A0ACC1I8Q1_9FUNG|nr:Pre-mRNA-splicing factor sap61 [Kickxella alabastrina]